MTRGTKTVAWALARATYARLHPNNTAFFNRRKSGSHPQPTFVPRIRNARATFCPQRHSCPAWTKTVAWASARATDLPLQPENTADHSVHNTPGLLCSAAIETATASIAFGVFCGGNLPGLKPTLRVGVDHSVSNAQANQWRFLPCFSVFFRGPKNRGQHRSRHSRASVFSRD